MDVICGWSEIDDGKSHAGELIDLWRCTVIYKRDRDDVSVYCFK